MIGGINCGSKTLCKANHLVHISKLQPGSQISLVFVRWRMSRFAPSRPRKLFFIPEKPKFDPEETTEMRKLNNEFNTAMASMKKLLQDTDKTVVSEILSRGVTPVLKPVKVMTSLGQKFRRNQKKLAEFNADTNQFREEYIESRAEETRKKQERELKELEEEETRQREIARLTVQQLVDDSKLFVTEENAHEQVEKMLETTKNYNFVIDIDGKRYIELPDMSLQVMEANESEISLEKEQTGPSSDL